MLSIIFQFLLACATSTNAQTEPSDETVVPIPTKELNPETKDANLPAVEEPSKSPPLILTAHKTIAVFNGFRITSLCTKLTANCPYKCGNTTEEAFFTILEYTDDTPDESTGVTKKNFISFSIFYSCFFNIFNWKKFCSKKISMFNTFRRYFVNASIWYGQI